MGLSDITPALTERRKRFEFVSGVDGKMATADHPRNEPAPTRDVASVQRIVIQITGQSATNILANRPIEVERGLSRSLEVGSPISFVDNKRVRQCSTINLHPDRPSISKRLV